MFYVKVPLPDGYGKHIMCRRGAATKSDKTALSRAKRYSNDFGLAEVVDEHLNLVACFSLACKWEFVDMKAESERVAVQVRRRLNEATELALAEVERLAARS